MNSTTSYSGTGWDLYYTTWSTDMSLDMAPFCQQGRHEACTTIECHCPCHDAGVREPLRPSPPTPGTLAEANV